MDHRVKGWPSPGLQAVPPHQNPLGAESLKCHRVLPPLPMPIQRWLPPLPTDSDNENAIELVECEAAPKLPPLPAKFNQDNHSLKCWCQDNKLIPSTSGPSSSTKSMSSARPCGWLTRPTPACSYCRLGEQQRVHPWYFEVGFSIWDYTLLINHPSSLLWPSSKQPANPFTPLTCQSYHLMLVSTLPLQPPKKT